MLDTALIASDGQPHQPALTCRPGRAAKVIILLGSGLFGVGAAPAVGAAWAACQPIWVADPCSATAGLTHWVLQSGPLPSSVAVRSLVACLCRRSGTQPRQRAGELHGGNRAHAAAAPGLISWGGVRSP